MKEGAISLSWTWKPFIVNYDGLDLSLLVEGSVTLTNISGLHMMQARALLRDAIFLASFSFLTGNGFIF